MALTGTPAAVVVVILHAARCGVGTRECMGGSGGNAGFRVTLLLSCWSWRRIFNGCLVRLQVTGRLVPMIALLQGGVLYVLPDERCALIMNHE